MLKFWTWKNEGEVIPNWAIVLNLTFFFRMSLFVKRLEKDFKLLYRWGGGESLFKQ
jgi:hypothetical protein